MAVVGACVAALIVAVFVAVRWGDMAIVPPWTRSPGAELVGKSERPDLLPRVLWWAALIEIAGLIAGLAVAGAGGRLVMRLLAVTAGDAAQGRLTEADEVVGRVSVGGTIGFVIFGGLFAGLLTSVSYFAIRRWLPAGRPGAVVFGALLLVVAATRVEPLRADNPDFDLVGPPWLALTAFVALALFHSLVLVAVAGRLSRSLPMPARRLGAVLPYLPLLLLGLTGPFLVVLVLAGGVVALLTERPGVVRAWRGRGVLVAGRSLLVFVGMVALPGFVRALRDILDM